VEEQKIFYRCHLPHWQPEHSTYFVTFRLAGSLPHDVIMRLKEEYAQEEEQYLQEKNYSYRREKIRDIRNEYFNRFDELLNSNKTGPSYMSDPMIAEIIAESIRHRDGKQYDLITYCIMPNHVHIVFSLADRDSQSGSTVGRRDSSTYVVANILENLKWYTALKANRLLKRTGQFWQHESYDHVVRDGKELDRIIRYVLNNPVKARLAREWQKWRWNYVNDLYKSIVGRSD
jgi:putative transposase